MLVYVAPLAGAWIEIIDNAGYVFVGCIVAPLAGAWIEIITSSVVYNPSLSRAPRGRVD